ncbi:DUF4168 domain-containing protein [Halomonas sp. McH1-25]|uniref:DUF4168 domain-containing protein n=1 Tax=unclassified Halomonas TaxID=2609666 RepID=UPI001EF74C73|nr:MULTISPECIES: DUF4168 domain-containing protein [unclassified Halomonas]MCG7600603.1 DUF4168 domain-containing protein [Halomonas sp. McH1-25]MCP1343226.1 DUF4168 domain-containing protein [Halomonas sp. FL8]MCP1359922.1 DUF4168 domain-containing protein [Halomonas sp. BBD45]MCP1365651.1 DUF4168 domain-containing protein [Halomonas sp. BBD48]
MRRMTALFSAALLSAGMMSVPAMAQQDSATQQGGTAQQGQAATQDFTDQQLQQFADASQEIAQVSQDYTQRLQEAQGDQAKQQEIRMEANDKMIAIVEESGLDVETFNSIGQAIQQNPELMKRVQEMVQSGS